jgi:FKBP-type peptidyl-prolyl cis-trans isomerase 2
MTQAKPGDSIQIHFTGTFDDGTIFDSSINGAPIAVTIGNGELIPSFEKALEGMSIGGKKSIRIPAADAYGEYYPEYVQEFDRSQIAADGELKVGTEINAKTPEGHSFVLLVTAINGDKVTVDGNHPMAGKDLNFDLELVDIVSCP